MHQTLDLRTQSVRVVPSPEFTGEEIAAAIESLEAKIAALRLAWDMSATKARALEARYLREATALFALADRLDIRVEVNARLDLIA